MDGFCVGEPWNARAVADGVGFTAITSQELWPEHPEKVLGFTAEFADRSPRTVQAVLRAMLESSRHVDAMENRPAVAEVLARPQYLNTPPQTILPRLLGDYDYGDGRRVQDARTMTFFAGDTNFPWKSHGLWWVTQFRRWGMVGDDVDYAATVNAVHRPDLYRTAAATMGVAAPAEDMKTETLFDGVVFDPAEPERYARGFTVNSMLA
jgi:nitrate/nitrite transport system substrate-binding protein